MSDDATKKKRRRAKDGADAPPEPPPGAGTPEGEKLAEANVAFDAGNYARVRALTDELARASDPKVVDAAAELRRRVSVDPVQLGFLMACLIALLAITYVYVLR